MHHADRSPDPSVEDRLLIVVRHGDAGIKSRWDGPDRLRPLSPTGRRQAQGLVLQLEDYPIEQILSSPTVRCQQTVEPLARDRFLPIELVAALGVDAGPAQLEPILSDRRLGNAVLCTHGETISQLFTQLAMGRLEVEGPLGWPKGSAWLLWHTPLGVRAHYLPPLALDPVYTS
jgi:phosphohistidine phosphatase SixA